MFSLTKVIAQVAYIMSVLLKILKKKSLTDRNSMDFGEILDERMMVSFVVSF